MVCGICTFICKESCRLDIFLRTAVPGKLQQDNFVSNSKIRRLIIAGKVCVGGKQIRIPAYDLHNGDTVTVAIDTEKFFSEKQVDDIKFEVTDEAVLYEDDVIIIVNKPAFFPTEETIVGSRDNLHAAVVRYLHRNKPDLRNPPYAGIMHRLDRETSGVILFTKQRSVNAAVHDMFENHTARKIYRAVTVCPSMLPLCRFSADTFTGRVSVKSAAAKWGVVPEAAGGVPAHTDFVLLEQGILDGRKILRLEAYPLTGRTHQIRVHLAGMGMPILGDVLYGAPGYRRIMLHACELSFPHPVTGELMTVKAPLPEGF
jgi:23S rRNA pseudouridine1911/1915/1917 synthase